ncbi:MAG: CAP domain-containing protein [Roseiarcus sp.]|jgi:uncharacterized protein YkwD
MRLIDLIALGAALGLAGCGGEEPLTRPISAQAWRTIAEARVDPAAAAAMLTAYRAAHGLGPVRLDPALTAMAQREADAMVAANALSHDLGGGYAARLEAAGVDTVRAGENIGGGYGSTAEAMAGWRHSPEHDANLLLLQATRFGIAIAKDAQSRLGVYWAMEVAAEPGPPAHAAAAAGASDGLLLLRP